VTRTHLSDAEVLRLHARRESLEGRAEHLLDLEVRRDPAGAYAAYSGKDQCGRLYGVAQPLTAQRGAERALLSKVQHAVRDLILSVDARLPQSLVAVSPGLCDLTSFSRRAQGAAWSSHTVSGPGPDAAGGRSR
jgi:hypothetical protein